MGLPAVNFKDLSIIIPLGPDEDQLDTLLDDLRIPGLDSEIIIVSCGAATAPADSPLCDRVLWIVSPQGRAQQQNAGAKAAKGEYLWFLHADSRVSVQVLNALKTSVTAAPDALHYFHLKFRQDGPRGMRLNERGAWFRSQILKIPFGDQGFCLHRDRFKKIGGFPEQVAYGEDHLLVWHARQAGMRLRCTGTSLSTSARKYRTYGWGALTVKYQVLWITQALPELYKLIRGKFCKVPQ